MRKEKLKEREQRQREKLAQTQARLKLVEAAERHRASEQKRKEETRKKIQLGGVVIAAGAADIDPAELCGWLLFLMEKRTDVVAAQMYEKGLSHFQKRKS